MKVTLNKLIELNRLVGKYLVVKMPEIKVEKPDGSDWFKSNNYIAANHNAFDQGFVEEVFSRFLRTLS